MELNYLKLTQDRFDKNLKIIYDKLQNKMSKVLSLNYQFDKQVALIIIS